MALRLLMALGVPARYVLASWPAVTTTYRLDARRSFVARAVDLLGTHPPHYLLTTISLKRHRRLLDGSKRRRVASSATADTAEPIRGHWVDRHADMA